MTTARQSIQAAPMNSSSTCRPTAETSPTVATTRTKKLEQDTIEAGLVPPPATIPPLLPLKREPARDSVTGLASKSGSATGKAALDEDEAIRVGLESIGMHVGANITEKLCRDQGMFAQFVCKDIWAVFWGKQVD